MRSELKRKNNGTVPTRLKATLAAEKGKPPSAPAKSACMCMANRFGAHAPAHQKERAMKRIVALWDFDGKEVQGSDGSISP
jgi:hypothetical protein